MINPEIEKAMDEFYEKFLKYFENVLKRSEKTFFSDFQLWYYVLTHFTNKEIIDFLPSFICHIFTDDEALVDFYYDIVEGWHKTIIEEQEPRITSMMAIRGASRREAMYMVDRAFSDQVGYSRSFAIALLTASNTLQESIEEHE